jgi:hypothetical protein
MPQAVTCSQCKAPVTDDRWINCPYCGALLVKPVLNPNKAVVAPERFAAVENSPEYARWMQHTPSTTSTALGLGAHTAILVVFCGAGAAMTVFFAVNAGMLAVLPLLVTCVGLVLLFTSLANAKSFASSPLERRVLVWRDERTEVSGGGKNSSATTSHYVLLEDRRGGRREYSCNSRLAGAHAPGDIGVAFLRGGILLDFKRVAV